MASVNVSHAQLCVTAAGMILTVLWIPGAPRYLHTLGVHLSTALIPLYSTFPTTCKFCTQQDKLVSGHCTSPRSFPSSAQLQAGSRDRCSPSTHCQPAGFAVSDTVIREVFVKQRRVYTVKISIIYPELLTLVSNHPAGDVVYLAGMCKHTSRATVADLSTWKFLLTAQLS